MSEQNFVYDGFNMADETIKPWDGVGGNGGTNVPEGEHLFEAIECTQTPTKAGDGMNIVVKYKVVDGNAAGEEMTQWYLCAGDKFKPAHRGRIVHVFRNSLRVPLDQNGGFAGGDVVGKRMYATCRHETRGVYKPETQQTVDMTSASLSMERPIEDEAAVATGGAKAASAPPSRPPAAPARPAAPPSRPAAPPTRPASR
jgi:hypothetical protein